MPIKSGQSTYGCNKIVSYPILRPESALITVERRNVGTNVFFFYNAVKVKILKGLAALHWFVYISYHASLGEKSGEKNVYKGDLK